MTPLTLFLAKLIGAYALIMSAWMLVRRDVALQMIESVSREPVAIAFVGMIRLVIGLAIVIGHDIWSDTTAALVSLIGWITLISGFLTLFLPPQTVRDIFSRMAYETRYPVFALISFALGGALLIAGFSA
ncbi:hypothetical protein [Methylocystis sp. SB2]|uniref:hypothetical protein n=1 Tax=Methylocystis sp. (strain SB2) TaxID=743836 RepID=UPI000419A36C|nr:hypothetical protein [Methylocystis sp. SB2]PWB91075.1 hypothetical protein C5688_07480 [Methylocystis sp. MitZ-2018]ULO24336.1 hypothetical protein LNB28_02695 [Methylocystis sp. SB2]